jgi:hypothetical protein
MHPLKIVSVYGDRTGTETKPITRACSVFPGSPFFGGMTHGTALSLRAIGLRILICKRMSR